MKLQLPHRHILFHYLELKKKTLLKPLDVFSLLCLYVRMFTTEYYVMSGAGLCQEATFLD